MTMTPRDAEAKGRSGYFKVARIQAWQSDVGQERTHIEVQSKRLDCVAACRLELSREDRRELIRLLQDVEAADVARSVQIVYVDEQPGIDDHIQNGLACPNCGSRRFRTLQYVSIRQDVEEGEWGSLLTDEIDGTETIEVRCQVCGIHVWSTRDVREREPDGPDHAGILADGEPGGEHDDDTKPDVTAAGQPMNVKVESCQGVFEGELVGDTARLLTGPFAVIDEETQERWSEWRCAAQDLHYRDGECEIDDNAVVSEGGDSGAYVSAWVWVPLPRCNSCGEPLATPGDAGDCEECRTEAEEGDEEEAA